MQTATCMMQKQMPWRYVQAGSELLNRWFGLEIRALLLVQHLQGFGAVPDPACLAWTKSKLQMVSMLFAAT